MAALWIIVPAAGIGARMQSQLPKQYLPLAGKTVLEQTMWVLLQAHHLKSVVVALHPDDQHFQNLDVAQDPRIQIVVGGAERADSVLNALLAIQEQAAADDWVLVHDAARPCLQLTLLNQFIDSLFAGSQGGILAAPVADTLKRVGAQHEILATQDRTGLWAAQTPQMFTLAQLLPALQQALAVGRQITDEASAIEAAGHALKVVPGPSDNLKITRPEDLPLAELILRAQRGI